MSNNVFENYQNKKNGIVSLTKKAKEFNFITDAQEKEILDKLNNDILTIGVIGQMKCGKSTFLNAFVFEDDILPAATTPMTASLSIITYGEEKKVIAEFYSEDEWNEQKVTAKRPLDGLDDDLEIAKINAAKELIEKSKELGSNLESLLGTKQEDSFENLIQYVGAEGRYVSITKSVRIYYPKEYLKGVEIVDTPGLNDPIASREERTKEFLSKSDVVLLMLYAGRPFDATDRTILFENVRNCGIGKVLIGINKYDISYKDRDTEEQIQSYVEEEIRKASKSFSNDSLIDILNETKPVLLSANMALLSEISMSKINNSDEYSHAWQMESKNFKISTQKEFREKSHIDILGKSITDLIQNDKGKVLFIKPINSIKASGANKRYELEKQLQLTEGTITILKTPDDELEEKSISLSRINKKINNNLDFLQDDINDSYENVIHEGRNNLENIFDKQCDEMNTVVNDGKKISLILQELDSKMITLYSRKIKYSVESTTMELQHSVQSKIEHFFVSAGEIFSEYLGNDIDINDFIEKLKRMVSIKDEEINSNQQNIFTKDGNVDKLLKKNIFSKSNDKNEISSTINDLKRNFNSKIFFDEIYKSKTTIVTKLRNEFITELIDPLQNKISECKEKKDKKDQELKNALQQKENIKKDIVKLDEQMKEIDTISGNI